MPLDEEKAVSSTEKYQIPIIFFDGVCGLCNSFVDWVIQRDKKAVFRFAPLQGETAKQYLGSPFQVEDQNQWTVILVDEQGTHNRSTAVLRILKRLGGILKIFLGFYLIPVKLRDLIYKWVAKHRYQWFGKMKNCRIPTAKEKSFILP